LKDSQLALRFEWTVAAHSRLFAALALLLGKQRLIDGIQVLSEAGEPAEVEERSRAGLQGLDLQLSEEGEAASLRYRITAGLAFPLDLVDVQFL